jgi:3-hydroxybutyryl-CoA dehydrogenase
MAESGFRERGGLIAMDVSTVGVVGSGTMGAGIAQVVIQNGMNVLLFDIKDEILNNSLQQIKARINRLWEKGKVSEVECQAIKERIKTTTNLEEMKICQLVIEAAPEKISLKQDIFQKLDEYCSEDTILATNTSSFSITEIASFTSHPERVAGLHFFNPAPLMPLVEVIRGLRTSQKVVETLALIARRWQKDPVICEDTPGFIVNRVARAFYNEALKIQGEGTAKIDQIDRIMKKAGLFKMGPFELQDMIGIDINYSTTESVYQSFSGEARFRPHHYQRRMVQSGQLGRKAGRGYFTYES